MNDKQIKNMTNRFLQWKLPADFHPDGGISFEQEYNKEYMAKLGKPPMKHEPIGTNLFTATQAETMIRFMLEGVEDKEINTAYYKGFDEGIELKDKYINGIKEKVEILKDIADKSENKQAIANFESVLNLFKKPELQTDDDLLERVRLRGDNWEPNETMLYPEEVLDDK